MNDITFNETIQNMILIHLDGWVTVEGAEIQDTDDKISPFMTPSEATGKPNKTITEKECESSYLEALDLAYIHTNRLNIDDLSPVEARMFIRGVCKWCASNLWNKYNIRVNNEDMEDTYVQSYGGLLYKSALKTLQPFINQKVAGMSSFNSNSNDDDFDKNIWIV